jgi:hypothetical protein
MSKKSSLILEQYQIDYLKEYHDKLTASDFSFIFDCTITLVKFYCGKLKIKTAESKVQVTAPLPPLDDQWKKDHPDPPVRSSNRVKKPKSSRYYVPVSTIKRPPSEYSNKSHTGEW